MGKIGKLVKRANELDEDVLSDLLGYLVLLKIANKNNIKDKK